MERFNLNDNGTCKADVAGEHKTNWNIDETTAIVFETMNYKTTSHYIEEMLPLYKAKSLSYNANL